MQQTTGISDAELGTRRRRLLEHVAAPGRMRSAHNIEFRVGDVLVTETSAPVRGYNAELERAMIVGPPTDEMRRLFDHMCAAHGVARTDPDRKRSRLPRVC